MSQERSPQQRQLRYLLGGVVLMFVFAVFLMPPLYSAFCELTGLNGKPALTAAGASSRVTLDRTVRVEFVTSVDAGLPWRFEGETHAVDIHPGQIQRVNFHVVNEAGVAITGRAVPSIAPSEGARYLKKTQCFCFREQTLAAGAVAEMPVIFYIDPDLPRQIHTLTLAYRFYRQPDAGQRI